jgi:pimeloyl-ACP methyl ester carboxylesterase
MRTILIAIISTLIVMILTFSLTTLVFTGDWPTIGWMSAQASALLDSAQTPWQTLDPPLLEEDADSSQALPDDHQLTAGQTAVRAVVVKSWGGCTAPDMVWDDLNQRWREYGSISIHVDYAHPGLCDGPVTYQKLVDSGADVLILSNPAGGGKQFSTEEIEAIQQYLQEGHDLIGTYAVFQYGYVDNHSLAPLFGLATTSYKTEPRPQPPVYEFSLPEHSLFVNLSNPFSSYGYSSVQVPNISVWTDTHLDGAVYLAKTSEQHAAILVYEIEEYRAIYFSNMPEYGGEMADRQLLYNAITLSRKSESRTPLVFIPGLMGSRLFNHPDGTDQEELWADLPKLTSLFSFPHPLMPLELADDGDTPAKDDPAYTSIHTIPGTDGIITRLTGYTWGFYVDEDFYDTLVEHFLAQGYIEEQDFWVFPYDWRKDLSGNAELLDIFIQEIQNFTSSDQVDILAHSLGGLVTRRYVSEPEWAENIHQIVILGTPFTGTPKAFHALQDGECLFKLPLIGYCLPKKHVIEALIPNYPSLYQLMPSQDYFLLKGGGFYGMGRTIDVSGICSECLAFHETYSPTIAPRLNPYLFGNAVEFHYSINDFTDWNGVDVTIVAGQNHQTLVGVRQYPRWSWGGFDIGIVHEPVFRPAGDGTVTLISASLANSETGINLLDNANLQVFNADHQDLVTRADILAFIHSVFNQETGVAQGYSLPEIINEDSGVQIIAYGAATIHAYDSQGNHTGPFGDHQITEVSIPGSQYTSEGELTTLALTAGQEYTITVVPTGRQPIDLKLIRTGFTETQSIALYLDVPVTEETHLNLTGDPFEIDTWQLVSHDGQVILQNVSPISVLHNYQEIDTIAPTVTISLDGKVGLDGWYQSPITVSLEASDEPGGSGIARIEYATQEDHQVRIYTGPFILDPDEVSVLYAVAVDLAGNMSEEAAQVRISPERVYLPVVSQ